MSYRFAIGQNTGSGRRACLTACRAGQQVMAGRFRAGVRHVGPDRLPHR